MKAMIFAAGLGTRLKPFTDKHPKALAEICGRPMLGIVINQLKKTGINEIVVNVHHFASQIIDYLHHNDNFGITVHISDERSRLLDTGGGILAARSWLDGNEPFILHNVDILTDVGFDGMLAEAERNNAVATLLVAQRATKRYLLFAPADMRMKGWTNIETGEIRPSSKSMSGNELLRAFGGIHLVTPDIFPLLASYASKLTGESGGPIPKFSIMDFYVDSCADISVYGYIPSTPYYWHDIGKPASLLAAEKDFVCS